MARNDEWCMFCESKMKQTTVRVKGKEWEVCNHCKSLTVDIAKVEICKGE
jgi:ribosome-binding protein aMBF1 (putative translation factor)